MSAWEIIQTPGSPWFGWRVRRHPAWEGKFILEELCSALKHPAAVLRDDARSYVAVFVFRGEELVQKVPRERNRRRFSRLTTLWRMSEAERTFANFERLETAGIKTAQPVLVLENRRYGMVVDSIVIYRYLKGRPLRPEEEGMWVEALRRLHRLGWVHRDPHIDNFLLVDDEVFLLDCSRARPWNSSYLRMYDHVLLKNSVPEVLDRFAPEVKDRPLFKLAAFNNSSLKGFRRLKAFLRSSLGIKRT